MRSIIDDYVKRLGVSLVLDNKHFSGLVDVHYYNFVGTDGMFYSLLVVSNDTQILVNSPEYFGLTSEFCCDYKEQWFVECDSALHKDLDLLLNQNLRVFPTKDDWIIGKWKMCDAKGFSAWLENKLKEFLCDGCVIGDYRVMSHRIWIRPSLGFSIVFSKGGNFGGVINIWSGCKTELEYELGLYDFVCALGVERFISWRRGITDGY